MDRVAAILRLQWRAYWRRVQSAGNFTTNNSGLWILFGGIAAVRYLQQLPGAAAQLAKNETARYETLLLMAFLVWMLPVMGESWRSISSRELLHTPLTFRELFFIRLGSVFVSPVSWVVAACSLALCYPLAKAAHPVTGIAALLLFLLFSLAMSLTVTDVLSSSHMRKLLLVALVVLTVVLGGSWLAKRRALNFEWWPNQLVANAAVGSKPVGPIVALGLMTIAVFSLAYWAFVTGLQAVGGRRSQRFTFVGLFDFPGRFGGLLKKDLRYVFRLLDLYFAFPIVILFAYYLAWAPDPSATIFRAVLVVLFLPCISVVDNCLGFERPLGLDRYTLFPLTGRDILMSKNLSFAVVFLVLGGAIFPFALWRFGVGVTALGLIELVLIVLAYLTWGNWMSVRDPYKMQFYRFSAGGSPADAIIGMFFGSVPGVIMIYLLNKEGYGALWKIALLMLLYVGLYYFSATRSGRQLEERREEIRGFL